MFRKDLIALLRHGPMTVTQIARLVGETPGDLAEDLEHVRRSLKHTSDAMVVAPARCRKCDFEFDTGKLRKPSKCPQCHSTWLTEPQVSIRSGAKAQEEPS